MATSTVTIIGNVTREPKLEYTPNGAAVLKIGVAVNRSWKKNDEWQEETSFFNVVAWSDLAENTSASLQKGDRVIVSGRLQQRSWETEGNEKRSAVEVVADDIGVSTRYATASATKVERSRPAAREQEAVKASEEFFNNAEPF